MQTHIPNREEALELLFKYNKSESLINHARSVEAVMRYAARKYGENEDEWGVIGLAHDLDYEQYPEHHCIITKKILDEAGWDEKYIRAILAHGWNTCTDIEPITTLEKTLYAIDELTGLVTACALVRPSRSVMDLEVKSVKKKWKDKAFAAGASREIIAKGAELLCIPLDELIEITICGMREIHSEIGL
jgi:predicted hydrolase (HD superfamily)